MNESRKRSWSVQLAPFRYESPTKTRFWDAINIQIMQKHITKCTKTRRVVNKVAQAVNFYANRLSAKHLQRYLRDSSLWRLVAGTPSDPCSRSVNADSSPSPTFPISRLLHNSFAFWLQAFSRANSLKRNKKITSDRLGAKTSDNFGWMSVSDSTDHL